MRSACSLAALTVGAVALSLASFVACSSDEEAAGPPAPDSFGANDGGGVAPPLDGSSGGKDSSSSSGGGAYCAALTPKPGFCEDFDDGKLPEVGDARLAPQGQGGSVDIDKGVARSAPNSFKVVSVPSKAEEVTFAELSIPAPAANNPTRFVVGFAYRSDAAPPTQGVFVIARAFLADPHQITIEFSSENGPSIREIDGDGAIDHRVDLTKLPAAKAWIRYELEFDLASKKVTAKADGANIGELELQGENLGSFGASLGIATESATSQTAYYDDIVIDLK